jgi:hypothetical protein
MPSGPRPLRRLVLTDCFICLNEVTLPHLVNLTSLKFSTSFPNPDSKYSTDTIWTALKASGIHLEELDLGYNTMAASLVDYLSTFSGLKTLRMHLIGSAAMVARFWSAAFPNHMNTLENFALYEGGDGEWCLFLSDCSLILQCRKVKYLMLSILCGSEQGLLSENLILESTVSPLPSSYRKLQV